MTLPQCLSSSCQNDVSPGASEQRVDGDVMIEHIERCIVGRDSAPMSETRNSRGCQVDLPVGTCDLLHVGIVCSIDVITE